jgi:PAS domain S-box-containing protein
MQKILAIDDKMDNLVTLSALLKNLMPDCTVITARSGMEGIAKAKAELPDAILLDVKMPDMDGFETCHRLMSDEKTKNIPVIMITAIETDQQSRIRGMDIGANAFLAKPINEFELVSQVNVALRIKKAEDALREERNSLEKTVEERTATLRRMNAFLDSILENIPNMIFLKDARELRFVRFNRAGEDLLGHPREDLLGKNDYDFFPKEQADFSTEKDRKVLHGKEVVDIPEEPIQTRNKGERILHTKKVPILNANGEPEYLLGISEDITERKRAEEKLISALDSLRKAVSTTIQVMVSSVETRDPYTAGHQARSTDLARVIAIEMGLPQEKIDAIRMAGSIHDIGKLSIPAEILSKPTELSEIEYLLIKEHSIRGYEILKDVESPWPLAEIVLQHHERMDGSGYPRGLKGKEILMEARILAVADVVESMASHRPYRPALGLAAALEEIEKQRGILYDPAVVDVCLTLFKEKGFVFS